LYLSITASLPSPSAFLAASGFAISLSARELSF
jgi:hypothetical protein